MSEPYFFIIDESVDGQRIDKVLAEFLNLSRQYVQTLLESGAVLCNQKQAQKSRLLKLGDQLVCVVPDPIALAALPEDIPLDIRYEDDTMLIVNKPQGMVVHPAAGHANGTLVNALLWHCGGHLSGINGVLRPGIVHRIDKDTSGLLAVAKTDSAHRGLAEQIAAHSFLRIYQAVCHGVFKTTDGTVDAPIGRSEKDRKRMAINKNGRQAVTHFAVVRQGERFTHVRLRLETGRTHQIRVHMASIGHPVAGDPVYGPQPPAGHLAGQCLHAGELGFIHPITGMFVRVEAELPPYFVSFLASTGLGNST